jgi:hypothetical protein
MKKKDHSHGVCDYVVAMDIYAQNKVKNDEWVSRIWLLYQKKKSGKLLWKYRLTDLKRSQDNPLNVLLSTVAGVEINGSQTVMVKIWNLH